MENLQSGIYQHYKGDEYELLFVAEQTENHEELAVYRSLKDKKVWARPASMWNEEVDQNGKKGPRFTYLREAQPRYPEAVVGPLIYNDQGEVFLIQSHKWPNVWSIPGGHIEWGEKMEATVAREIEEETSLQLDNIEFVFADDGVNPKNFTKPKHFIFLNFFAHFAGGEPTLSDEMSGFIWIDPKKALKELPVSPTIIELLERFIARQEEGQDSWEHRCKRALADYQNLLKQGAKDKEEFVKYAVGDLLQDLLPVYDHLKMSLSGLPEGERESAWVKGVEYVLKQFKDVLSARGVEEIKTVGEKFNHHQMEALEGDGDTVDREVMPGYTLNGRVIRAAKVIVK